MWSADTFWEGIFDVERPLVQGEGIALEKPMLRQLLTFVTFVVTFV